MKKQELQEFIFKTLREQEEIESKKIDKKIADLVSKDTYPATPEIDGLSEKDIELFKKLKLAKKQIKNIKNACLICSVFKLLIMYYNCVMQNVNI